MAICSIRYALKGMKGFNATSALTFQIGLPRGDYPDRRRIVVAHQAILDRLASVPGITAVSATTCLPSTNTSRNARSAA